MLSRVAIPCLVVVLLWSGAVAEESASETRIAAERALVEDDYVLRLSLPTEEDREAWAQPGFRVAIGIGQGSMTGAGSSPSFAPLSFSLRPSVRLDEWWSLGATFAYGVAASTLVQGLRWSATAGPTLHPWRGLAISFGMGLGGLDIWRHIEVGDMPRVPGFEGGESVSRTLDPDELLPRCSGTAWSGVARIEYLFVVGPLFATGPFAQADLQWTRCEAQIGGISIDTGHPVMGRQWWRHHGGVLGWWLAWR